MSDLNPYPGNLKHHKVDKEEQRKLLCEMMKDDAKSGMYDTEKRPPLLSDEAIHSPELTIPLGTKMVRDIYESARAKDAELIQKLVDALHAVDMEGPCFPFMTDALNAAASAGFKPSEP